jgi:hypothetical protein
MGKLIFTSLKEEIAMSDSAATIQEMSGELRARSRIGKLWQLGALFHNFSRYPRKRHVSKTDRLAGILQHGLLAPASRDDGSVCSDLNIVFEGAAVPYDSLVFLHRYGERSWLYTISEPGRMTVFVDPSIPVITPEELEPNWAILCQDEVYVRDGIAAEQLMAVVVHPADAETVLAEFQPELERLGLPLYLYDGTVVWPSGS